MKEMTRRNALKGLLPAVGGILGCFAGRVKLEEPEPLGAKALPDGEVQVTWNSIEMAQSYRVKIEKC